MKTTFSSILTEMSRDAITPYNWDKNVIEREKYREGVGLGGMSGVD